MVFGPYFEVLVQLTQVFLRPRCDWVRGFTCLAWPWKWSGCHEASDP